MDLEARVQPDLPETSVRYGASGAVELEFHPHAREGDWTHTLDFVGFARHDASVSARSHADLRELLYSVASRDFELRAGVGRVFWGVTEAAHLVDIVNQDDGLEDLDGEDKLGQGMLSAAWTADWGIWRAFLLPRFRPREFPGPGLLPVPFPIVAEEARFESAQAEQHLDIALRWQDYFGPLDLAVSWFQGTGREPRLVPCAGQGTGRPGTEQAANCDLDSAFATEPNPVGETLVDLGSLLGLTPSREELEDQGREEALKDVVLVPHYDQIEQFGLEAQLVAGNWAFKFEGRRRLQRSEVQHAAAAGFEYTQGAAFDWPVDFGYVLEYLYDDRSSERYIAPLNNDLLLAFRALFSDVAGTQLLAGVIQDLDDRGRIFSVEASRRLGEAYSVAAEMRLYSAIAPNDGLYTLRDTDLLRLTLSRYF